MKSAAIWRYQKLTVEGAQSHAGVCMQDTFARARTRPKG